MFTEPFMLIALGVGSLSGGLCAYLGNYVIMKKMTFISIALAEMAALGVALSMALHVHPFHVHFTPELTAILFTIAGACFFWQRNRRLSPANEGIIGLLYVSCAAFAVILLALHPRVEAHGINLVSGNMLYCSLNDLVTLLVLSGFIGTIHYCFKKEIMFVAFDKETATAQGLNADRWDLILMLSIGLSIGVCIKMTGVLFVFASMTVPALTALTLFNKVKSVFVGSVMIAVVSVIAGTFASYHFDLPTSPAIICVYTVCFVCSLVMKRVIPAMGST